MNHGFTLMEFLIVLTLVVVLLIGWLAAEVQAPIPAPRAATLLRSRLGGSYGGQSVRLPRRMLRDASYIVAPRPMGDAVRRASLKL